MGDLKQFRSVIKKLLEESLSSIVYHFLPIRNLTPILEDNKINFSTHLGTNGDSIHPTKGYYFLSLTRSKAHTIGYARNMSGAAFGEADSSFARIKFDGNKLNHRFKGAPADYWQRKDFEKLKAAHGPGANYKDVFHRAMADFESEDRLFSKTPFLDNANKYILQIDVFIPENKIDSTSQVITQLKSIISHSESLGISLYVYTDIKNFERGNIQMAKNQELLNSEIKPDEEPYNFPDRLDYYFLYKVIALIIYSREINDYEKFVAAATEYLKNYPEFQLNNDMLYKAYDYFTSLKYGSRDFIPSIQADIHNISKKGSSSLNRTILKMLSDYLRKVKANSILDLINLKTRNIRPSNWQKYKFSSVYNLAYIPHYEDDPLEPIDNSTPLKEVRGIYFSQSNLLYKEDQDLIWKLYIENKTMGEYIDFLLNRFTFEFAEKLIAEASDNRAKLIKK